MGRVERTSCWHLITRLQYLQSPLAGFAAGFGIALDVIILFVFIGSECEGAWIDRTDPVTFSIGSASQRCRG